jgi:hypothetical protein
VTKDYRVDYTVFIHILYNTTTTEYIEKQKNTAVFMQYLYGRLYNNIQYKIPNIYLYHRGIFIL